MCRICIYSVLKCWSMVYTDFSSIYTAVHRTAHKQLCSTECPALHRIHKHRQKVATWCYFVAIYLKQFLKNLLNYFNTLLDLASRVFNRFFTPFKQQIRTFHEIVFWRVSKKMGDFFLMKSRKENSENVDGVIFSGN